MRHLKFDHLLALGSDIAVVSEACVPDRIPLPPGTTSAWTGRLAHKGLLVLAFGDYQLEPLAADCRHLEWIVPTQVRGPREFTLLGVWSMNRRQRSVGKGSFRLQPLEALDVVTSRQRSELVAIGDFNNNVLWDRPRSRRFQGLLDHRRLAHSRGAP